MPDEETLKRARRDKARGKSPSTQAGEFVREEMRHIREGKHGARSPRQAIAIGLSKARRAGVELPVPSADRASEDVRRKARKDLRKGESADVDISSVRSRAIKKALMREDRSAASPRELSQQARRAAEKRSPAERKEAARKAATTKGKAGLQKAAKKAARSRQRAA